MRVVESGLELGSGKRAVELEKPGKQGNRKEEGGDGWVGRQDYDKDCDYDQTNQKEGRDTKRKNNNKRQKGEKDEGKEEGLNKDEYVKKRKMKKRSKRRVENQSLTRLNDSSFQ